MGHEHESLKPINLVCDHRFLRTAEPQTASKHLGEYYCGDGICRWCDNPLTIIKSGSR